MPCGHQIWIVDLLILFVEYYLFFGLLFKMWTIIPNVEKLNICVDNLYYVENLNNYCGDKLIYCLFYPPPLSILSLG